MLQALALTPCRNQHLQHATNSNSNGNGNKGKELTGNKQQQDCNEAINRKMALRHAIILWGRVWPRRWAQEAAGHINVAVAVGPHTCGHSGCAKRIIWQN